jgi:hypothetical protein
MQGDIITLEPNVATQGLQEGGGSKETTFTLTNNTNDLLTDLNVNLFDLDLISGDGNDPLVEIKLVHNHCEEGKEEVQPHSSCTFGVFRSGRHRPRS